MISHPSKIALVIFLKFKEFWWKKVTPNYKCQKS